MSCSLQQSGLGAAEAGAAAREALAAADADGDGRLSLDEFAAFCAARAAPAGPVRPDLLAALGPVAEGAPGSSRCWSMSERIGKELSGKHCKLKCVWLIMLYIRAG